MQRIAIYAKAKPKIRPYLTVRISYGQREQVPDLSVCG
jgi:hypothetical protein